MLQLVNAFLMFSFVTLALTATPALAQTPKIGNYPERPIRIIVGNVAGGALDAVTRAAGRKLSDHFGQSVVIDNRPGAGSVISQQGVTISGVINTSGSGNLRPTNNGSNPFSA